MKLGRWLLALGLLAVPWKGPGAVQQTAPQDRGMPSARTAPGVARQSERYVLTPEKRAKAIAYSRARYILHFLGVAISIILYWVLWRGRVAALFRDWARRVSRRHFVQCLIFVPLFFVLIGLLEFPLDYYSGFVLEHRFDLSTQGFGSWLGDWGKSLAVAVVFGVFLVSIFYWVVRCSPRRWWLYFWLVSIPIALVVMLVEPYVIEPLFFKFTPLEKTQPALTIRIEGMLDRASLKIPPSRIFEMDASHKTKIVNAYVSGIGASKRVVVWDTTLKKMTPDETLLVLGHETGHYVLHHIPQELALNELVFLGLSFLGFIALDRIVERQAERTRVEGIGDLASLPIVLLVLTVLVFCASPVISGISRHYEHQADQFGLEVTYGVVPDPNAAEVRALQVLGEENLADPDPNPFIKFWLYSHPPLDERIRFAATYKPWAEGKPLELVHPKSP
jgi:Zn-dependent protease with chaperone function